MIVVGHSQIAAVKQVCSTQLDAAEAAAATQQKKHAEQIDILVAQMKTFDGHEQLVADVAQLKTSVVELRQTQSTQSSDTSAANSLERIDNQVQALQKSVAELQQQPIQAAPGHPAVEDVAAVKAQLTAMEAKVSKLEAVWRRGEDKGEKRNVSFCEFFVCGGDRMRVFRIAIWRSRDSSSMTVRLLSQTPPTTAGGAPNVDVAKIEAMSQQLAALELSTMEAAAYGDQIAALNQQFVSLGEIVEKTAVSSAQAQSTSRGRKRKSHQSDFLIACHSLWYTYL
jgi:hypothetical protein